MSETSERQYPDMWVDPQDDPRETDDNVFGEKASAIAYLERYRSTMEMKCEGLDAEQLARRSVPPSTMSLLGLVRHLAKVEHHWFRRVIEAVDEDRIYWSADVRDVDFDGAVADDEVVADAWASWHREVDHARAVLDRVEMDDTVDIDGEPVEIRDLVVHMIEEYARHAGHADLLRECIDGRTGQ